MNIRIATPKDAVALARLVTSLAHYYLDNPKDTLPVWLLDTLTEAAFTDRLSTSQYQTYLYVQDDEIAGYIAIKDGSHLYHLFVPEHCHGQGIARRLWQHVLNLNSTMTTCSLRASLFAVPVYERFGFVNSGPMGTKEGISFQPMVFTR